MLIVSAWYKGFKNLNKKVTKGAIIRVVNYLIQVFLPMQTTYLVKIYKIESACVGITFHL